MNYELPASPKGERTTNSFKKALSYSFLLLKYRPRSKGEILGRLGKKGFDNSIIEEVLFFLQERKYIDDWAFVQFFVSSAIEKGWGREKILYSLKKYYIPLELCADIVKGLDYKTRIKELIFQKVDFYRDKKNKYQRIKRFLLGRGFDYEDIIGQMSDMGIERFEGK